MARQISQNLNAVSECGDHPFSENHWFSKWGCLSIQKLHSKSVVFAVPLNSQNSIRGQPAILNYQPRRWEIIHLAASVHPSFHPSFHPFIKKHDTWNSVQDQCVSVSNQGVFAASLVQQSMINFND